MPVAQNGSKQCPRCGETKLVEDFSFRKQTTDGLHPYCRACDSLYKRGKNQSEKPPKIDCAWCGENFQPTQRKGKYCSSDCKYGAKNNVTAKKVLERKIGRKCEFCGDLIEEMRADSKWCSVSCRRKALRPKIQAVRRRSDLRTKYGLTLAQLGAMTEAQRGLCAICQESPGVRGLVVDHCHKTDRVRGLLCDNCNHGIGKFKDDPVIMQRAILYLG